MSLRLTALCLLSLTALAAARPLEDELPVNGDACWQRVYDAAHLKAHPKQKVERIRLAHKGNSEDGTLYLSLDMNLRKRTNTGKFDYVLGGYCKADGAGLTCTPEWDAGTFSIEKGPKKSLLIHNHHMVVNPSNYDAEDIADKAVDLSKTDDATWMLQLVYPENCEGN